MTSPNVDAPPPEGSGWAEPSPPPYDNSVPARFARGTDLVVLWSSVLVFVVITVGLLHADDVIYSGTNPEDTGELDGLNALAIVVLGVFFGLMPLTLAIWNSLAVAFKKRSGTRRNAGFSALYAAACGAITIPKSFQMTTDIVADRRVSAAAIAEANHIYWVVGLLAFIPLVVFLYSLRAAPTSP